MAGWEKQSREFRDNTPAPEGNIRSFFNSLSRGIASQTVDVRYAGHQHRASFNMGVKQGVTYETRAMERRGLFGGRGRVMSRALYWALFLLRECRRYHQ